MPNCNFAVRTKEEVKKRGDALILRLQKPGENQGAALDRGWDIIEQHLEASRLKAEGVDIEGLDSALSNVRHIFVGMASGRTELEEAHKQALKDLRKQKEEVERDLRDKLKNANMEKELVNAKAESECQEADQLRTQIEQLNSANAANVKLIKSIEEEHDHLKDTLAAVTVKAQESEQILDKLKASEAKCAQLQHEKDEMALASEKDFLVIQKNCQEKLEEQRKTHQEEILALRAAYEKDLQTYRTAYVDLMHAKGVESRDSNSELS